MNKHPKPLPQKPPFGTLRKLSKDVMAEVDTRLLAGEGGSKVAEWLQIEAKVLVDVQPATLKKTLERYRKKELREKAMQRIAMVQRGNSAVTLANRANALDQMDELVRLQRARLQKLLNLEEGKPMLLGQTTEEIRVLQTMLVNLGQLQLETGVMGRAARKLTGSFTDEQGDKLEFSWTEEQEKLYEELSGVVADNEEAA